MNIDYFFGFLRKIYISLQYQNDIIMKEKILFSERQTLRHPLVWLVVTICMGAPLLIGVIRYTYDSSNEILTAMIILTVTFGAVIALFLAMRLETIITKEGIRVKFFPFHRSFRYYKWDHISKAVVGKTPVFTYKNMGIHYSMNSTLSYNIMASKGLRIDLTTGRKLFIGTKKAEELEAVLYRIGRLNKE